MQAADAMQSLKAETQFKKDMNASYHNDDMKKEMDMKDKEMKKEMSDKEKEMKKEEDMDKKKDMKEGELFTILKNY